MQRDDASDPRVGVLSRAAELGVMSLLGSASGPVSLDELLSAGSCGVAASNDLEAVMGALVELKVVEETHEPKAYRLRPENMPNAAGAGGEQSDGQNSTSPYQVRKCLSCR